MKYPIMIGSLLDRIIRGVDEVKKMKNQFGAFIIRGEIIIIPHFLTNNTNGIHTRRRKKQMRMCVYTIVDMMNENESYSIKVNDVNNPVEIEDEPKPKRRKVSFIEELNELEEIVYEKFIRTDKFKLEREPAEESDVEIILSRIYDALELRAPTLNDLLYVMKMILSTPIELDSLSNKIILTPAAILSQVVKSMDEFPRIEDVMTKGTMYFVLSKNGYSTGSTMKLNSNLANTSLYTTMSGSKQNNIQSQLRLIKRSINERVKKTQALFFPEDGDGYICKIASKELEGSGEIMEMAQYVIVTTPICIKRLIGVCKSMAEELPSFDKLKKDHYIILYGDYISYLQIHKDKLLEMKQKLPMIVYFVHDKILRISYTGNLPVKYSHKYNIFVSPHEKIKLWPDAFEGYTYYSKFGYSSQLIPNILRVQPAKATVFYANCKGSAVVFDDLEEHSVAKEIFRKSGGYHTALIVNPNVDYSELAKLPHKNIESKKVLSMFKECRDICKKYDFINFMKYDSPYMKDFNDFIEDSNEAKRAFKNYLKLIIQEKGITYTLCSKYKSDRESVKFEDFLERTTLKGQYTLRVNIKQKNKGQSLPKKIKKSDTIFIGKNVAFIREHYELIVSLFKKKTPNYQFQLYCAYGDYDGGTVEDGIIADVDFIKNAPVQFISNTTRVSMKKKNNDKLNGNDLRDIVYKPMNVVKDNEIIYGIIYSKQRLLLKSNDNIKNKEINIRNIYQYTIYSTNYLQDSLLDSYMINDTIITHYELSVRIGIGTKIANVFGQKNVISKVVDLSEFYGYNINGECIKPQILFPIQSLVGRATGSQYLDALESKTLVLQPKKYIKNSAYPKDQLHDISAFGKVSLFVHNHHPIPKLQSTRSMKNDLWTNQNGMSGNRLSSFPVTVENQNNKNNVKDERNIKDVNEIFNFGGIKALFLQIED